MHKTAFYTAHTWTKMDQAVRVSPNCRVEVGVGGGGGNGVEGVENRFLAYMKSKKRRKSYMENLTNFFLFFILIKGQNQTVTHPRPLLL
jgi:hypothetical protein